MLLCRLANRKAIKMVNAFHLEAVLCVCRQSKDFSLSNDLAKANPKKLAEMQVLFMTEAVKYNVLQIDDRLLERITVLYDSKEATKPVFIRIGVLIKKVR
jgi:hypothetical protein